VNTALGHLGRVADVLEKLVEVNMSINNALVSIAERLTDTDTSDDDIYRPRPMFDVELPEEPVGIEENPPDEVRWPRPDQRRVKVDREQTDVPVGEPDNPGNHSAWSPEPWELR
jgi:hypothetical protein